METMIFEKLVRMHSLAPNNMIYNGNALAGETGEVCNQIKKVEMGKMKPEWVVQRNDKLPNSTELKDKINDELGDTLFYLTRVALDNNSSLDEIMSMQVNKLNNQSIKYGITFLK